MANGNGAQQDPLLALLDHLRSAGYAFVTPTPETHRRVLARKTIARDLRDAFGWNLPFPAALLPAGLLRDLEDGGWLVPADAGWASRIRVSSLAGHLFVHSGYPTDDRDAVFFGPDSYRFARFLGERLTAGSPAGSLVDLGAGTGVGAIVCSAWLQQARLTTVDVNPLAVRFARVNAAHAGVRLEAKEGNSLDCVTGKIDVVIANPPYLIDPSGRTYRHGGLSHGAELSLHWVAMALGRLAPGGRLLLYTGSAIVDGEDCFLAALRGLVGPADLHYEELDPDVFGEELDQPGYEDVERIAVVGAEIHIS